MKREERKGPGLWLEGESSPPSVLILISRSPYDTEHAFGGLSLAIACAHQGIATRVVFLEDGIYALSGAHARESGDPLLNIQDIIDTAENANLQLYAFQPSFARRGIEKNGRLTSVFEIGMKEMGELLFDPQKGVRPRHQRVLFF